MSLGLGHHCGTDHTAMEEARVSLQISLPVSFDQKLNSIQEQLGLRSKSFLIERLLREIFDEVEEDADQAEPLTTDAD